MSRKMLTLLTIIPVIALATLVADPTPVGATIQPYVTTGGAAGVPNGGHSCALMPDRSVWCWGFNSSGQLGSPQVAIGSHSSVPVKVQGLPPASGVAAGANHTCAVDTSNRVWCWGDNSFGELGNGTFNQSSAPVQVTGLQAYQVSSGDGFSCAVTLTHAVNCWGDGNFGELGNGTTSDSTTPVAVTGLTNINVVAAGYFHACALNSNRGMKCWGSNPFGALGNGTTTDSDVPVQVTGLDANVEQIAAGDEDTCAILIGGDLKCWGINIEGQLETGTFTDENVPTQAASLTSGVDQVTLGEDHGCAIIATPGAQAICWGDPAHGAIGNGQFAAEPRYPFATAVFGLSQPPAGGVGGPEQIAAGFDHTCVALFSGKVECWGDGSFGDLGTGTTEDRAIPTPTIGLPGIAGSANTVSAGGLTGCALDAGLSAKCWGVGVGDGTNAVRTTATKVIKVPAGGIAQVSADLGGCVLTLKGVVRCWGDNTWGQVGNGTSGSAVLSPSVVTFPGTPAPHPNVLTTGGQHSCALTNNGGAYCWGDNQHGQLGDGTTTQRDSPVAVQSLSGGLAQIAAGAQHTCGLLKKGTVQCWGANGVGELGNGSTSDSSAPVNVSSLSGVVQIALGGNFSCALSGGGGVSCWGYNADGELGNGTTTQSNVPVAVSGIGPSNPALAIAAGDTFACAVLLSHNVECWGANGSGQLGNGTTTPSSTPVTVSGFSSDGSSISAGPVAGESVCALNSSEQAECWGSNQHGQLGDGTTTNRATPVFVTGL